MALKLDGGNPGVQLKANLRAAKACLGLGSFEKAQTYSQTVMQIANIDDKTREECEKLRSVIEAAMRQEEQQKSDLEKRSKLDKKIDILLGSRRIERVPDCEREIISLLGPAMDLSTLPRLGLVPKSASQLQWPVIFFYPPCGESDFIEAMHEQTTLADTLGLVFDEHPTWDTEGLYKSKSFRIYFHTNEEDGTLFEVSPKYRLCDLYGKLVKKVDRGLLGFFVLPAGNDTAFLQRFGDSKPVVFKP